MPSFSWHQGNGQRCKDSVYELFQPTVHRMQLTAVTDIPFSSAYQVTLCHPPSASDYMTDENPSPFCINYVAEIYMVVVKCCY